MKVFYSLLVLTTTLTATGSAFAGGVESIQTSTTMKLSGDSSVVLFEKFAKAATCETVPTGSSSYQLCKFSLDWRENQDVFAIKNKVVQMTCSKINDRDPTCSLDITQN